MALTGHVFVTFGVEVDLSISRCGSGQPHGASATRDSRLQFLA